MTMAGIRVSSGVALLATAFVLAAPVGADAAGQSVYQGKTAQSFKIRVAVGDQTLDLIRFKIRLRCLDGSVLLDDLSDFEPTRLRAKGRFADIQFGPTDEVRWKGRLRGSRIRGIVRVRDTVRGNVPCDSGQIGFSVRFRGR